MDVNGKAIHRLTTNGRDGFPAWSPDGKQIVFLRPSNAKWSIYAISSSGGKPRRLARAPSAGRPTWSSRGLMIPSGGDLAKIDAANGRVQKYFGAQIDAVWGLNTVALAPDDSRLTFIGARAPDPGDKECGEGVPCQRFALYSEDLLPKTKPPRLLVKNVGPATFSPDGKQLAFVAAEHEARSPDSRHRPVEVAPARRQLRDARSPAGLAAVIAPRRPTAVVDCKQGRASRELLEVVCAPAGRFCRVSQPRNRRIRPSADDEPGGLLHGSGRRHEQGRHDQPEPRPAWPDRDFPRDQSRDGSRVFTLGDVTLTRHRGTGFAIKLARNQQKRVLLTLDYRGPLPAAVGSTSKTKVVGAFIVT